MMNANPHGMEPRSLGASDEGIFVLPVQHATDRRREYFERGQRILATYAAVAAYSEKGREFVEANKLKAGLQPTTPVQMAIGEFPIRTTLRRWETVFSGAGAELARQFTVAIYGNLEAFLADHVSAAFTASGEGNAQQETIRLLCSSRWRKRIDKITQRFDLSLGARALRATYRSMEMALCHKSFSDPVDFLQTIADLRHRVVHSSGRVDKSLVAQYPRGGLTPGELLALPLDFPFRLWFFLIPLSEEIDRAFADRFGWPRETIRPEVCMT